MVAKAQHRHSTAQHRRSAAQLEEKETWPNEKARTAHRRAGRTGKEARDRVHVGADVGDKIMEFDADGSKSFDGYEHNK